MFTASTPTNAIANLDYEVPEGSFAYAASCDQGEFRVKFSKTVNGENVTVYENDSITSDISYNGEIEPGTYTLTVLAMDCVGQIKIDAFDPATTKADSLLAELVKAVENMPATK